MEITLKNKNSLKICVSNFMPIGAPGIVLWRFSRYFWNAPRAINNWSYLLSITFDNFTPLILKKIFKQQIKIKIHKNEIQIYKNWKKKTKFIEKYYWHGHAAGSSRKY